ncbi:MAG: DUF423 domain-containing protein [Luminiphilus sp.]|nr:DUF423 domain-containing protein [Luminiphilus sp.]
MNLMLGVAGLLGASGVAAGAFGAHALESIVTVERLAVWETGAQYHLMHAAVILCLALQNGRETDARWFWPMLGFTTGTLLFSFSLYALVLTNVAALATITPLGGLLLIISWLLLIKAAYN